MEFNYSSFKGNIKNKQTASANTLESIKKVDLTSMASLSLGYLKNNPLPDKGYQSLFSFAPFCCPPLQPIIPESEGYIDPIFIGDTESRNDMAFNMINEMLGIKDRCDAQEGVHKRLLSYIRDEGIYKDICWNRGYNACITEKRDYASLWSTGMLLQSLCDRYRQGDEKSLDTAKRLYEGIKNAAVRKNGRAFFNVRGAFFDGSDNEPEAYEGHYPFCLGALCEYYLLTKDTECYTLMTELAEGFMYDMLPHCLHRADGGIDGHNHVQLHAIKGMAQFAFISKDPRYIAWVKAIYDYYHSYAIDTGWLPEIRSDEQHDTHSETCLNADMLETELWLALSGYTNLFDRIERSIRNYFVPCQFYLSERIERLYRKIHASRDAAETESGLDFLKTRLTGGFISALTPNDKIFTVKPGHSHFGSVEFEGETIVFDMMGCCPPEGMRAIYYAYRYAAEKRTDGIFVNLNFSVDKPFVKTEELPDGVIITAKSNLPIYIRVPSFCDRDSIRLTVNGEYADYIFSSDGNSYIKVDNITEGDTVELRFAVPEFDQTVTVAPQGHEAVDYTYHWVGNTVTAVDPKGKYLPIW